LPLQHRAQPRLRAPNTDGEIQLTGLVGSAIRMAEAASGRCVLVVALLLSLVVTWPLVLHIDSAIYGYPGDALGTISDFWWFDYALHHGLPLLYNQLRGVPLGSGWENVYFDVVEVGLFAPLSYVLGPVIAYNLGVLSSFPLTAWVTFLLARRLQMTRLASTFTGLTFAFVPYHQEKAMVHLLHTHMELYAAFLYFAIGWRQTRRLRNIVLAAVVAGITLWTDPSMTYLMAFLVAIFFVTSLLVRGPDVVWRQQLVDHAKAAAITVAGAAVFIPAVVAVSARGGAQRSGTFAGQYAASERTYQELVAFSARIKEYVLPWHLNPLLSNSLRAYEASGLHGSNFAEQTLTIGFTTLVLAAIGLIAFRRTYGALLAASVVVVAFIVSQPPDRSVFGIEVPFPSHFLYFVLPIFRAYARFGALVLLGAAVLAGFGFMALQGHLAVKQRWLLAAPFLLVALEFNGLPPSHDMQLLPAPAEYTWLKSQPAGTLIEYPIAVKSTDPAVGTEIEVENRVYVSYQQVHEHPMFNGATATSQAGQLAYTLEPYYASGVSDQLRALGIRYVFVHRAAYERFGRDPDQSLAGYRFIQRLAGTDIYVLGST